MRFLLSLLVTVLASVSASSNQATHASFSDAFFPAHTHSMLVHPSTIHPSPSRSAVYISISAPTLLSSVTSSLALSVNPILISSISTVADTQRRVMGLIPLLTTSTLPITSSLNNLPHASIQLSIQSTGDDANLAYVLSTNDATHIVLKDVSYAADDVALATTLSTGKQPKDTGVVARTWVDSTPMTAFSSAASSSHVATVADIVSQSFDGQSLVLSISADSQMSMANCIHPSLATTNNARWNFFCVSLDDKTFAPRQFPTTSNIAMTKTKSELTRRLTVSRTDLIQQLTSAGSNVLSSLPSSISVVYGDDAITIDGITFSLTSHVDISLLLELQYIHNIISVLSESDLIQDGIPDHIAINVASLQTIRAHYGVDSPQYRVAMKLVEHCLPSLMSRLSDIYDDSVVRTVILLGNEPVNDSQLKQHMTQHVKEQLSLSHLPFLSISDSASVHSVCTTVDATLRRYGYAVYCPDSHLYSHAYKTLASVEDRINPEKLPGCNATGASNCTIYNPYRVQKYQILLWFSIILVLITLSAIFTLCCMKFKKDTMLYSSFNPNWEDRKRR